MRNERRKSGSERGGEKPDTQSVTALIAYSTHQLMDCKRIAQL